MVDGGGEEVGGVRGIVGNIMDWIVRSGEEVMGVFREVVGDGNSEGKGEWFMVNDYGVGEEIG